MSEEPSTVAWPPSPSNPVATSSLWETLDLPPPEAAASQHQSKRIVLLGRPLSGKRTLCRRLCLAAEAQYPSTRANDDGSGGRAAGPPLLRGGGNDGSAVRRALYKPKPEDGDDDIVEDAIDLVDDWEAQRAVSPSFGRHGTGNHYKDLPHGAGIVHDYVVQRIPLRTTEDSGLARGGVTKRTVEFFCCDTAGALSAALPTLQSLEEALVLIVVDVSQPGTIREQLDRQYEILQTHVTSTLQTFLPTQDEVRRLKMTETQQRFWLDEEQRLLSLREQLGAKTGEQFVGGTGVKMADVNKTVLRVPLKAMCPVKSVIVCTKTDVLDKVGKLFDTTVAPVGEDELPKEVDEVVPPALRSDLKRQRSMLFPFVTQLIRQYAILRQSALVAVSTRVNTTATDSAGEAALVHPFYRGVWSYLSDRLEGRGQVTPASTDIRGGVNATIFSSSAAGAASSSPGVGSKSSSNDPPLEAAHLCTANFFPTAFLPSGLDTLAVLQPAIASQSVTLPLPSEKTAGGAAGLDEALADGSLGPNLRLHWNYLQQVAFSMPPDRSFSPGSG